MDYNCNKQWILNINSNYVNCIRILSYCGVLFMMVIMGYSNNNDIRIINSNNNNNSNYNSNYNSNETITNRCCKIA